MKGTNFFGFFSKKIRSFSIGSLNFSGNLFPAFSPKIKIIMSPIVTPMPPMNASANGFNPPIVRVESAMKYEGPVNVETPPKVPRRNIIMYPFLAPNLATKDCGSM